ncbi:beta strand repeat-containing protein [Nostoc sp.]|uniref:beta strand repeat-containing protein n=1 Tax=Nostoc sp. TaxID=1180 RepID=UPI002FF970F3
MAIINGTNGNDTLNGTTRDDLINGLAGDDKLDGNGGNDTLNGGTGDDTIFFDNNYDQILNDQILTTGGGGKDKFVFAIGDNSYRPITITDFGGIGKGSNPSAAVIAELDTLEFSGSEQLAARNLQLTQNGNNTEIRFEGAYSPVVLQNFALENLDNLAQVGNILFDRQTRITDSFDVFNANSTQNTIFNKNTVTFLNDLSNNVNGFDNSDDVINGQGGNDIIDGKSGNDLLRGGAGDNTLIGGAGNDTLESGTENNTLNGGAGDDYLNIVYSTGDNLFSGGDGNDSLFAYTGFGNNILNGGNGNDTFYINTNTYYLVHDNSGNDTLTGGGGKDKFVCEWSEGDGGIITITDFDGIGQGSNPSAAVIAEGSNPSAAVIAEVDTLQFTGDKLLTARNLQLTQNGNNLEITFESTYTFKVVLQNFALENLDNLAQTGNILFDGQTSITDSFDVFNANSTQSTIFNLNTVTFLNDLNNNVNGFDNSDDVINGQGGNDIIDGKSGNDLLRGGAGNDTLIGGIGDDVLLESSDLTGDNLLSGGDGNDTLSTSSTFSRFGAYDYYMYGDVSGNNTLNGGAGDDNLGADISKGDNLLSGGDGNDFLSASGDYDYDTLFFNVSGNNTLNGGAGNDTLNVDYSVGNNLLSGDDGNDYLSASKGKDDFEGEGFAASGNNTLDGGAGNDTLNVDYSKGDNLLFGGDGNDSFYVSSPNIVDPSGLVTQTVDGGKGDDLLSVDYGNATEGITTTFNATTNIGSITEGTNLVSYKNIERLNISGTRFDDNIVGNNGNDTLSTGYGGNDTIDGGIGDDSLSVDYGNATGGITTTFNATTNIGSITEGTNLVSYKNIERLNISGTRFDDNIVGSNGNDTISTGYSYGYYINNSGNDTVDGGTGDDLLSVDYSNATGGITTTFNATTNIGSIITAGTNQVSYKNIERLNISGTRFDDNIVGSNGNDTISIGYIYAYNVNNSGNDTVDGGTGDDLLSVNYSHATGGITTTFNATTNIGSIITAGMNQVSYKNIERLNISGTSFDDNIVGNNGNDTLNGAEGNDILTGGNGNDTFAFRTYDQGVARVDDFNATNELIQVSSAGFGGGLLIGSLQKSQFTIGASATTSNQRFIYDSTTGGLYFDSDGSAAAFTQVKFAQLSAGLSLTNNNFVVV